MHVKTLHKQVLQKSDSLYIELCLEMNNELKFLYSTTYTKTMNEIFCCLFGSNTQTKSSLKYNIPAMNKNAIS